MYMYMKSSIVLGDFLLRMLHTACSTISTLWALTIIIMITVTTTTTILIIIIKI